MKTRYPAIGLFLLLLTSAATPPALAAAESYGKPSLVAKVTDQVKRQQTPDGQSYSIVEYEVPTKHSVPHIIAIGPSDTVWFGESGGRFAKNYIDVPAQSRIGRLDQGGTISEWDLGGEGTSPMGIQFDAHANLWIAERLANRITRVSATGERKSFAIPTPNSWPTGLSIDAHGDVWFSETKGDKIGVVRLASGHVDEFPLPAQHTMSTGIVAGPNGQIWLAERDINTIGRFDSKSATFTQYHLSTDAKPCGITVDAEGTPWFTERGGGKIGRILANGSVQEFALDDRSTGPFIIVVDRFGDLWFSEIFGNRIGRFAPQSGKFEHYTIPTDKANPAGIALDSKGNVWFAEQTTDKIGVIVRADLGYLGGEHRTSANAPAAGGADKPFSYHSFDIPTAQSIPGIIAVDPKGVVWFTEMGGGFVGPGFPPGPPGSKVGFVTQGKVGEISLPSPESGPTSMGLDPKNGDVWVTLRAANKIARIRDYKATEFEIPIPNSLPVGIAVDADQNVWVALSDASALARMTPGGEWKVLQLPEQTAAPRTVLVDHQNEIWFAEKVGNHIGWVDKATWTVKRWSIPTRLAWPLSLIEDDAGNIWFAEMRSDKLGFFNRGTQQITEYKMPVNSAPFKVYFDGKNRSMWVSTVFGNAVMRFDLDRLAVADYFPVPNDGVWIGGIDRDEDSCFWITEQFGNRVDRLCVKGVSRVSPDSNAS